MFLFSVYIFISCPVHNVIFDWILATGYWILDIEMTFVELAPEVTLYSEI